MYSTSVYLFTPRQIVVFFSGNSPRRYQIVYAKNLKLNKGVDNKFQFQFLNQEQKPVDITGLEISFRLINYNGTEIILRKSLTGTLMLNGLAEIVLTSSEIENVDTQMCYYSLEIASSGLDLPVFVNSEAGARGVIDVVDSVLPSFVPATEITIPSHAIPNNNTVTYFSSVLYTTDNPILTIQPYLDNYSGNIQIQGSTLPDSEWYNIGNVYTYLGNTETTGYTINGYHPYLRLQFVSTQGNITQILAR